MWDTSGLQFPLDQRAITHSVVKSDDTSVVLLKMADYAFDQMYSVGPKDEINVG